MKKCYGFSSCGGKMSANEMQPLPRVSILRHYQNVTQET